MIGSVWDLLPVVVMGDETSWDGIGCGMWDMG